MGKSVVIIGAPCLRLDASTEGLGPCPIERLEVKHG